MEFNVFGQRTYPQEPSGEPPCPPVRDYGPADCPPRTELAGKSALVIGFGLQGEPTALNLCDSGVNVTIGLQMGSPSVARVQSAGFAIHELTQPVPDGIEAVFVLIPDEQQAQVLRNHVFPSLHPGQLVIFAHGYTLLQTDLPWPLGVDGIVLAPHGPGWQLRERYLAGSGLPAQIALWRDPTGTAFLRGLLWGAGLGYDQGGMRPCTVRQEVELDWFVEQALLCGGLVELALAVAETAAAHGHDPIQAWRSTIGEIGNTAALLSEHGPVGMYKRISRLALKGSLLNGPRIVPDVVRAELDAVLREIESGAFAAKLDDPRTLETLGQRMALLKEQVKRLKAGE